MKLSERSGFDLKLNLHTFFLFQMKWDIIASLSLVRWCRAAAHTQNTHSHIPEIPFSIIFIFHFQSSLVLASLLISAPTRSWSYSARCVCYFYLFISLSQLLLQFSCLPPSLPNIISFNFTSPLLSSVSLKYTQHHHQCLEWMITAAEKQCHSSLTRSHFLSLSHRSMFWLTTQLKSNMTRREKEEWNEAIRSWVYRRSARTSQVEWIPKRYTTLLLCGAEPWGVCGLVGLRQQRWATFE